VAFVLQKGAFAMKHDNLEAQIIHDETVTCDAVLIRENGEVKELGVAEDEDD